MRLLSGNAEASMVVSESSASLNIPDEEDETKFQFRDVDTDLILSFISRMLEVFRIEESGVVNESLVLIVNLEIQIESLPLQEPHAAKLCNFDASLVSAGRTPFSPAFYQVHAADYRYSIAKKLKTKITIAAKLGASFYNCVIDWFTSERLFKLMFLILKKK